MDEKRKEQKGFMFYMPMYLYEDLKNHCHEQDQTMTKYILRSIVARLNMEKEHKDKIKW
jgi:hypothetical protein